MSVGGSPGERPVMGSPPAGWWGSRSSSQPWPRVGGRGRGEEEPDSPPAVGGAEKLHMSVAGGTTMILAMRLTGSSSSSVRYRSPFSSVDNSHSSSVGRASRVCHQLWWASWWCSLAGLGFLRQ